VGLLENHQLVQDEKTRQRVPTAAVGAIVTGSDYRALALVRSLGRRRIPVLVLTHGDDLLAAKSRYATMQLPFEAESEAERATYLLSLADSMHLDGWVVFPSDDEAAAMLGRQHERLSERLLLSTPPWDVLRWAYDKRLSYRLAQSLDVPYPRTWPAVQVLERGHKIELTFPLIIKPAIKEEFNALTAAKAWQVNDYSGLLARLSEATEMVDPELLLLQETIPGNGQTQLSYAALCEEGRVLASVTARRTRQYPADFGRASTFVETIEHRQVAELSQRLLKEMRFNGLIEVEFKRDARDGELKLLDINPRVWGWHSLCQRAGVDFPYLAWRLAQGLSVPASKAELGVRWLRFSTDLPTSLREIARGRLPVRDYLRSLHGPRAQAIFARDDPWPGLVELPMLMGTLTRRLRGDGAV
jgi:D-aspartate ligase